MLRSAAGWPLLPLRRWSVGPYTDAPAVAIPGHYHAVEGPQGVEMDSLADLLGGFGAGDGDDTPRPPLAWSDVTLLERDGACAWDAPRCGACAGVESVDGARCPCAGIVARARRLTLARIPWAKVRRAHIEGIKPPERARASAEWVEKFTPGCRGLRFGGTTGTGKTYRACAIVRRLCERGVSARFVHWPQWVRDYKAAMGRDIDQHGMRARIFSPDVVVIDDLGRERLTEYVEELLDEMVGGRLDSGKTIILTGNMSDEAVQEYVGDRLWSRLRAATEACVMLGEDRRIRGSAGGWDE